MGQGQGTYPTPRHPHRPTSVSPAPPAPRRPCSGRRMSLRLHPASRNVRSSHTLRSGVCILHGFGRRPCRPPLGETPLPQSTTKTDHFSPTIRGTRGVAPTAEGQGGRIHAANDALPLRRASLPIGPPPTPPSSPGRTPRPMAPSDPHSDSGNPLHPLIQTPKLISDSDTVGLRLPYNLCIAFVQDASCRSPGGPGGDCGHRPCIQEPRSCSVDCAYP